MLLYTGSWEERGCIVFHYTALEPAPCKPSGLRVLIGPIGQRGESKQHCLRMGSTPMDI